MSGSEVVPQTLCLDKKATEDFSHSHVICAGEWVTGSISGCENVLNQEIQHISEMTEMVHIINAILQATLHSCSNQNALSN